MDIPVNAAVHCTDGAAGRSKYVIINPVTKAITHIVVEERSYPNLTRLVPVELIEASAPGLIRLRCTRDELGAQELFLETQYLNDGLPSLGYPASESLFGPYTLPPQLPPISLEHEQVPTGELAIRRGTQVVATDGPVGRVDDFLVNPEDGHITHLVMRGGHLWGQRDVTIPVSRIDHLAEDTVQLTLEKRGVEALPAVPARHRAEARPRREGS